MQRSKFFRSKKFLLGFIITVFSLYFSMRGIDWAELGNALTRVDYFYLIPIFFLLTIAYWIRAHRWQLLLLPMRRVGVGKLFAITMIGFMVNNILPIRLGELYRVYAVGEQHSIGKSASLATVVVERIFDMLTLLLFLLFVSYVSVLPGWLSHSSLLIFFGMGGVLLLLLIMMKYPKLYMRSYTIIAYLLPVAMRERLGRAHLSFIQGLAVLKNKRRLIVISLLSIVIWLFIAMVNQLVFYAFSSPLSISAALSLLVITSIGAILPSAPGYIGTFQLFTVLALAPYGVEKTEALSISIFLHASNYSFITLLGLVYLVKEHLTFSTLENKVESL